MLTLEQRVERAARILDIVDGGWAKRTQPDDLDMATCSTDLICQLTGSQSVVDYEENAYRELVETGNLPFQHETHEALTEAWREQIRVRVA